MDEWARAQIDALEKRVAALEQQLRGGSTPAPTHPAATDPAPQPGAPPSEVELEVKALLREGKALQAIHTYVNRTGTDMATAKAEVGRIASSLSPQDFLGGV